MADEVFDEEFKTKPDGQPLKVIIEYSLPGISKTPCPHGKKIGNAKEFVVKAGNCWCINQCGSCVGGKKTFDQKFIMCSEGMEKEDDNIESGATCPDCGEFYEDEAYESRSGESICERCFNEERDCDESN